MASRTAGNITARGTGSWLVRISLPTGADGKRRWYSKTIRGTKKDAQKHLNEKLRELDAGSLPVRSKTARRTLGAYLEEWVTTKRARPRTLDDYRSIIRRYFADHEIAAVRLEQVQPPAVRRFYLDLQQRGLSPRTVQYAHAVLHSALEQAVDDGLIARNAAKAASNVLEKVERSEKQVLSIDQARRFMEAATSDRFAALWLLLLETGLRPAEALGLRWSDLDGNVLRIQRALKEPRGKGTAWRMEPPKTKKSVRNVPLTQRTVDALKAHRRQQAEERLAIGEYWADGCEPDLIFCTSVGTYLRQSNLHRRHFKPMLTRAGLPDMRVYDLRHSAATILLALGENPKVVQERLGHSTIAQTMDTYSHVLEGMQQQATARLEKALAEVS